MKNFFATFAVALALGGSAWAASPVFFDASADKNLDREFGRCDGCPNWGEPGTHTLGGAVQRPNCCCGEVPKKWERLERFEGDIQFPYGGDNRQGYCGIKGGKVEIILSKNNVTTKVIKKRATPMHFDLEETILLAAVGNWAQKPGNGQYGPMHSYVARFSDDYWLKIDLGSAGMTKETFNYSPAARILRDYMYENCGRFVWE